MGVGNFGWHILKKLSERRGKLGSTLMIGNQTDYRIFKSNLNYGKPIKNIMMEENLSTEVDIADISSYENANIVLDLSMPHKIEKKFNTLIDYGTIEHVFDSKQCIYNYFSLIEVGGNLILATPCNNYAGHGFFQFSPEFFYNSLSYKGLFKNIECYLVESPISLTYSKPKAWKVKSPQDVKSRINIRTNFPINILVTAERTDIKLPKYYDFNPIQSDYIKNLKNNKTLHKQDNKETNKLRKFIKTLLPKFLIKQYLNINANRKASLNYKPHFTKYNY